MSDRKPRGQRADPDTGEVLPIIDEETAVTEDTLGGLPRSNYLTGDFAADIQSMPGSEIGRVLDKFPYTKRGQQ